MISMAEDLDIAVPMPVELFEPYLKEYAIKMQDTENENSFRIVRIVVTKQ